MKIAGDEFCFGTFVFKNTFVKQTCYPQNCTVRRIQLKNGQRLVLRPFFQAKVVLKFHFFVIQNPKSCANSRT